MAFKRFLSGLCLGFTLLGSSAVAQELNPAKIAMWKVESKQNTIYLLGSIHVGKSCQLQSPRIDAALADAEKTVFEIDFTKVTPEDQIRLGLELSNIGKLAPGDRTLKESITPETYQKVSQKLDSIKPANLNITLDDLNTTYRPSFIALQMQGFKTKTVGISGQCGIDKILTQQAQQAQKPILALETFDQQIELLKTILSGSSQQNLEEQFQNVINDDDKEQINTLLNSVLNGDIKEIEAKIQESCALDPNLCTEMLDKRNIVWMDQIRTYLQDDDDYFIIVGAAHMVGPNSLITLLENENYQVEPF